MFAAVFDSGKVFGQHPNVTFVIQQVVQPWHPQGSYVHEAALAVKHLAPDKYLAFCSALYKAFDEGKFKDADTWDKSRSQIYADLVALAESVGAAGIDKCLAMNAESQECNQMTQHLKWACAARSPHDRTRTAPHRTAPCCCCDRVCAHLRSPASVRPARRRVKYHRCRGVHVTPVRRTRAPFAARDVPSSSRRPRPSSAQTVHVNGLEAGVVSSGWTAEQWVAFLQPQGADNWTGSNM
eukprot:5320676-Prymnesium_polylepis.1